MTTPHTPGTALYLEDPENAWIPAQVVSCTKVPSGPDQWTLVAMDDNGKEITVTGEADYLAKLYLRNPPLLESADDLATLSHLNEPSILSVVSTRYAQKRIYTYSGIVLLAVNPFEPVELYTPEIVHKYMGQPKDALDPHLFAIAQEAFAAMCIDGKGQTIIVSGESGAGKTESAKLVMRFIASPKTYHEDVPIGDVTQIEEQIQATNPILEAFGNAKTTRNDNSSRFGKYIQLLFDTNRQIVGARVRTYLLERSRLSFQTMTERNYHVFYQLCAGLTSSSLEEFGLDSDYSQFHYLNQGGPSTTQLNDEEKFYAMQEALSIVGIDEVKQHAIFRLLAALLHIGNINILHTRAEAGIDDDDASMLRAMEFLGVDPTEFKRWTIKKQISTRSEKIVTALSPVQAISVRDSIARFIYTCLFEWLVATINDSLTGTTGDAARRAETYIGVLDIYGFEHFQKNSFEQFCINYANEKLQHEFNTYVFKLAQDDYLREKINWTFIDFEDNQPAIDLMEGRLGVLAILDEESRLPLGNDASFLQKLNTQLDKPANKTVYKMPKFANAAFTIAHYALDVTYQVDGFLEKNRDTLPDEHLNLLTASNNEFLRQVLDVALHRESAEGEPASSIPDPGRPSLPTARNATVKKPTLGSTFKGSLGTLMEMLRMTNVHYIRCIKPNDLKMPWKFSQVQVLAQLRAAGVLETIRISTAGYPSRWTFEEFAKRYFMFVHWREAPTLIKREQFKRLCVLVLQKTGIDKTLFQMGETKIFLRGGVLAKLEALRSVRLDAAVLLQAQFRQYVVKRRYHMFRQSVVAVQSRFRGAQARRAFSDAKEKARLAAEAAKARKAAKTVADREKMVQASRERQQNKTAVAAEKAPSEHGSPGKTKIRRMFSFGSKEKVNLVGRESRSPEPVTAARRQSRLEKATRRISRSWYDDDSRSDLSPRKSPNHLAPPPSAMRSPSPQSFSTPIYERFMKPAWNSSTNLNR